jgi:cytochrome P450
MTCPMWPAAADRLLLTDRGAAWRKLRETGPVLRAARHPREEELPGVRDLKSSSSVHVIDRVAISAAFDDPALESLGFTPHGRKVIEDLFNPRTSRAIADAFRPHAAALIKNVVERGEWFDAMAALAWPMATKLTAVTLDANGVKHELDALNARGSAVVRGEPGRSLSGLIRGQCRHFGTLFGSLIFHVVRRREHAALLSQHPSLIPVFAEEVLRLDPAIVAATRVARKSTKIAGVGVAPGTPVYLYTAASDRDGSRGRNDELTWKRRPHWALGTGVWRCRASHLVRESLRVVVEEWVRLAGVRVELSPRYTPWVWSCKSEAEAAGSLPYALLELPLRVAGRSWI